jgi:RNA polymerase sigma-70 factor (ECF subfamily)
VFVRRGTNWRLVPVRVNGGTGLAAYAGERAHSVQLFEVRGGLIRRCVTFADPALFALFDLSETMPAVA